jgi:signal transduction histidine kinase
VLPYVLLALVFLPHLLSNVGLAFTAVQLALAACIYLSGNAATMLLSRGVQHPAARIGLLSLCYTATAIVGTLVMYWSAHQAGHAPSLNWSPAFIYPSFALALSIIAATARELAGDEQRLAELLAEQVQHTAHTHNRLRLARKQTAHVLHTAVQGELVAAALTLQRRTSDAAADTLSANAWGDVMTTIARIKQEVALGDVVDLTPAADRIGALVTMWGSALRLTAQYDAEVWPLLAADATRTEMAVDALSEGFTNAVRHGNGQRVDVRLGVDGAGTTVVITVRSSGVISSGVTNGLGLRSLRSATSAVTLSESRGEVSLVVELG